MFDREYIDENEDNSTQEHDDGVFVDGASDLPSNADAATNDNGSAAESGLSTPFQSGNQTVLLGIIAN